MTGAALPILLAVQLLGGPEGNTEEGAEHFLAGRLEEALRAFARARDAHPDAPESDLNLAGVHYRLGEAAPPGTAAESPFAEAVRGYEAGLEAVTEEEKRRDGFFNLGNAFYRSGAFLDAAGAFAEAIAIDPEDAEARQNLELALRRADEEAQQEPQDGGEQQEQQEQQDQEDQEGQQEQADQRDEEDQQDQPGQQDGEGEDDREPEPSEPDPPPDPGQQAEPPEAPDQGPEDMSEPGEVPEITPEQAERILAAFAEIDRAYQEEQLERRRARALRRGRH